MALPKGHIPWNKGKIECYSDETIERMSEAHKGKVSGNKGTVRSEESKEKMSESHKGCIPWNKGKVDVYSEEQIKEMSISRLGKRCGADNPFFGKKHTEETKQRISDANKGHEGRNKGRTGCFSEETLRKMSIASKGRTPFKGKHHSEEAKRRVSEANKGRVAWNEGIPCSDDVKETLRNANKGQTPWNKGKSGYKVKPCSDERRRKISKSHIGVRTGAENHFWKGGISFDPYCSKFNNTLREEIRERDDRLCQLCGKKENGCRHAVHHIHYLKSDCEPDLITLCMSCNSKVNTNRDHYEELFMSKLIERGLVTCTPIPTQKE